MNLFLGVELDCMNCSQQGVGVFGSGSTFLARILFLFHSKWVHMVVDTQTLKKKTLSSDMQQAKGSSVPQLVGQGV